MAVNNVDHEKMREYLERWNWIEKHAFAIERAANELERKFEARLRAQDREAEARMEVLKALREAYIDIGAHENATLIAAAKAAAAPLRKEAVELHASMLRQFDSHFVSKYALDAIDALPCLPG